MRHRNILILAVIALTSVAIACGGGGSSSGGATIEEANTQFQSGNYQTALQSFQHLIGSEGAVAVVGAGWCDIKLHNNAQADSFFASIAADSLAEGYAGWSFTAWYNNNPQQVVDRVTFVLQKSPAFVFSLDPDITKNSLLYIRATSYLQLQNYAACLADIKSIVPAYAYTLVGGDGVADSAELLRELGTLSAAT